MNIAIRILTLAALLFVGVHARAQQPGNYFVAVDIPGPTESRLLPLKQNLQRYLYGRFEPREKYHITLKYLGKVAANRMSAIEQALRRVTAKRNAFTIVVRELGFFPDKRRARVAWVGVRSPELSRLYTAVKHELSRENISGDDLPFRPHITLVRLSYPPPLWLLDKLSAQVAGRQELSRFRVKEIVLLRSYGGQYTVVCSFALNAAKKTDK